jgi:hypothetical protein
METRSRNGSPVRDIEPISNVCGKTDHNPGGEPGGAKWLGRWLARRQKCLGPNAVKPERGGMGRQHTALRVGFEGCAGEPEKNLR